MLQGNGISRQICDTGVIKWWQWKNLFIIATTEVSPLLSFVQQHITAVAQIRHKIFVPSVLLSKIHRELLPDAIFFCTINKIKQSL